MGELSEIPRWQLEEEVIRLRERCYQQAQALQRRDYRGHTIKGLNDALAEKNKLLSNMHYIWCTAACEHSHRGEQPLTKENVEFAEKRVRLMRSFYERYVNKDA